MAVESRTRVGPVLHDEQGRLVQEAWLRLDERTDLFVREKSPSSPTIGVPVVLMHGAGMDGAGFDVPVPGYSLVDALADHGCRTFVFDFRGHGRSSRLQDGHALRAAECIADAEAVLSWVLQRTGAERAVLVGESFGSMIAPAVAERNPGTVAGLALLGLIYASCAMPLDDLLEEAKGAPAGYAFTTEEEWSELFIPSAPPEVLAWHQAHFGTAYAYPVGPYFAVAELPVATAPERITCPVLVVTGDLDPLASEADCEALISAVGSTDTRNVRQAGVGHLPYVEMRSSEVQREIRALVDRAAATGPRRV